MLMTAFSFILLGTPQPKQRARSSRGAHHYTPKSTVQYEHAIATIARTKRPKDWPMEGHYHLTVLAYFPDRKHRDIDNVVKSVADGLNGVAYIDDNMVTRISAEKCESDANPRTEVTVQWLAEQLKPSKRKKNVTAR